MSTQIDPRRSIAAWLEAEAPDRAPARLIDASREHVRTTRQRPAFWPARRTSDMHSYAKWLIAAAAVLVVAIVGYNLLPSQGGVGGAPPSASPSPTPSISASPSIAASPSPSLSTPGPNGSLPDGALAAGTYAIHDMDNTGVDVRFTLPEGWRNEGILTSGPTGIDAPGGIAIAFWTGPMQVYKEPCKWKGAEASPPTGPTAQELVQALAVQPQRNASKPTERRGAGAGSAGQYAGWSVALTVPTDDKLVGGPCDEGEFRSWGPEGTRYHQGPGQRDTVWAVDVGDQRIIIDLASWPGTSEKSMTEAAAILSSMVFSRSS